MYDRFMIYGATGYTGKLTVRMALARGFCPVLAGRSAEKLRAVAGPFGLEYRAAYLTDADRLAGVLRDIDVVLNVAGPFSLTAQPLVDACLRTGTHYLDVTGELPVFETLQRRDAEARSGNVMIMPGVGFVVVPSDCLAAHVARRLPEAQYLRLGISRTDHISRGSVKTMIELVSEGVKIRRGGRITSIPVGVLERGFDYGEGGRLSTAMSWGDVFTAFYTTGISNVEVYVEVNLIERGMYWLGGSIARVLKSAPWQSLLKAQAELLPEGPTDEELATVKRVIVAEAEDYSGRRVRSRLRTPDGYTFTVVTALAIVERVLSGEYQVGFQTPARVYGADFVLNFDSVAREDLEA
jgi:short subunit dehydrogenase-like uncharacterized protein